MSEEQELPTPKPTCKIQLASLKAFMLPLGYTYFGVDRAFYSPFKTNEGRSWVSFNNAVKLHNGYYLEWHGKKFNPPFEFPEEWIMEAKASRIVQKVKIQNSKKKGLIVQSNVIELINKDNYDLFFN